MNNILIDSGFWIALYDTKLTSQESIEAEEYADIIVDQNLIIPFPTLYEFVSSRLSRKESIIEFEKILYRPNVERLKDTAYRDKALEYFFIKAKREYKDVSLVDEVIKLILNDKNHKIDFVLSFDKGINLEAKSLGIQTI